MQNTGPILLLVTVLLALSGCGQASAPAADRAGAHMKVLGLLYGQYLNSNGGAPPPNEEAFVAFLNKEPRNWEKLASSPEEFLASVRDGHPLVVRYGNEFRQNAAGGLPIVAYEESGDQRMLVNVRGDVESLDQSQIEQRLSSN